MSRLKDCPDFYLNYVQITEETRIFLLRVLLSDEAATYYMLASLSVNDSANVLFSLDLCLETFGVCFVAMFLV